MSKFKIIKNSKPKSTFRIESIKSNFDLQSNKVEEIFEGEINIEDRDWNIGIIYGNSGTGKSSIAKEIFKDYYFKGFEYENESIMDDMPEEKTVNEITKIFNSVGFSSPPSWLKSYNILSDGEKMRVDLARAILEEKEIIVFDEFTSVVDRNIAKIGSYAVQKAIRKNRKKDLTCKALCYTI